MLSSAQAYSFWHASFFKIHFRSLPLSWLLFHLWDSTGDTALPFQGLGQVKQLEQQQLTLPAMHESRV